MSSRISREQMYMSMAHLASHRSTCGKRAIGCIAVVDRRIVAQSYLSSPAGTKHCDEVGHLIDPNDNKCIRTVHAEAALVAFCAKRGQALNNAVVFTVHEPCYTCCKLLISAGVTQIIWQEPYREEESQLNVRLCQETNTTYGRWINGTIQHITRSSMFTMPTP